MKALEKIRLAVAALSGRVYAGIPDKKGQEFIQKKDVTSDFLKALIEYAEARGNDFEIKAGGIPKYRVTVQEITQTKEESGVKKMKTPDIIHTEGKHDVDIVSLYQNKAIYLLFENWMAYLREGINERASAEGQQKFTDSIIELAEILKKYDRNEKIDFAEWLIEQGWNPDKRNIYHHPTDDSKDFSFNRLSGEAMIQYSDGRHAVRILKTPTTRTQAVSLFELLDLEIKTLTT